MGCQTPNVKEADMFIDSVNRIEPALRFMPDKTLLEKLPLPFYPDAVLLKMAKIDSFGDPLWYVHTPTETVAMDGSLANIHHLNDNAPLNLTQDNIYAYLKFRYYFGRKCQIFEAQVKRSAVGFSGKVWEFKDGLFFEVDINVTPRGIVVELDRAAIPDVPAFSPGEFSL